MPSILNGFRRTKNVFRVELAVIEVQRRLQCAYIPKSNTTTATATAPDIMPVILINPGPMMSTTRTSLN